MSASQWRKAMNLSSPQRSWTGGRAAPPPSRPPAPEISRPERSWILRALSAIKLHHVVVLAAVLAFPWLVPPFFVLQIGAQSLVLGLIALSLMFLAGYGGMVSLAQMTVAGIAGYTVAILGPSSVSEISLGWPAWLAALLALPISVFFAVLIGWLSVRTEGIYTIMITLAVGVAFFYLAQQNYALFNGFQGFQKIAPPPLFGLNWRDPMVFFYLALFWALAGYFFTKYLSRAPFGIALQGTRDNARRMRALGFNVTAHRIAAYAVAGALAAIGGVLLVWYNSLITPGSVGMSWMINILIIAVLGGMRHPIGPFIGAVLFVLLQNFAIDLIDRERFNLVIGVVFLAIVLFSQDGLLGWWQQLYRRARSGGKPAMTPTNRH